MVHAIVEALRAIPPPVAIAAVFLLVAGETAVFLGFLIPGELVVVLAGALAGLAYLWREFSPPESSVRSPGTRSDTSSAGGTGTGFSVDIRRGGGPGRVSSSVGTAHRPWSSCDGASRPEFFERLRLCWDIGPGPTPRPSRIGRDGRD